MVNDARSSGEYDDVLLLDGGDLYQGTPVSGMTGGAAVRAALNAMDYDAIALGNHEFDWDENGGYIYVDTGERGVEITE